MDAREARQRRRESGGGGEEGELAKITHKFSFSPSGSSGTPQSVKTVTANVPQIRKVTAPCQVKTAGRGHVEFIYLFNRFRNSFPLPLDIDLQRVRKDKNLIL